MDWYLKSPRAGVACAVAGSAIPLEHQEISVDPRKDTTSTEQRQAGQWQLGLFEQSMSPRLQSMAGARGGGDNRPARVHTAILENARYLDNIECAPGAKSQR
jgi:hypothetical protein